MRTILPAGEKRPTDPGFSECESMQAEYLENLAQSASSKLTCINVTGISIAWPGSARFEAAIRDGAGRPEMDPSGVRLGSHRGHPQSSREVADIAAAYQLGANGYLVKPPEVSKLDGMVRAINDFWLTQNTPPPDALADRGPPANSRPRSIAGPWCPPESSSPAQVPSRISRSDI